MSQAYSNPKRAEDPHALPDVEVFYVSPVDLDLARADNPLATEESLQEPGWYWWACFPGCLPDGDPVGPFKTEAEALADAQRDAEAE